MRLRKLMYRLRIAHVVERHERASRALIAREQQIQIRAERRLAQVIRRERCELLRREDIVDERLEHVGAKARARTSLCEGVAKRPFVRQRLLSRELRSHRRQVACRVVEPADCTRLRKRSKLGRQILQTREREFIVLRRHDEQVAHVGGTERATQRLILDQQLSWYRGELAEIVFPERRSADRDREHGSEGETDGKEWPARQRFDRAPERAQAFRFAVIARGRPHESRQDKARREAGCRQSRDRETSELLQPRDAREEKREVRDARTRDAGCKGRPQRSNRFERRDLLAPVAQDVSWIVLRDTDERESERERNAMYRAEEEAHARQADEACARKRQDAKPNCLRAAIGNEDERDQADRRRGSEPSRFAACA